MDNLSRDSNPSYLPVAGVIAGVLALILSVVALAKVSGVKNDLTGPTGPITEATAKAEAAQADARKAQAAAASITENAALKRDTQAVVNQIGVEIGRLDGEIKALKEAGAKKTIAPVGTKPGTTPVAGANEYVVKQGDNGGKIAAATGFTVAQLEAVNPGIVWTTLKVGQHLKLPAKK